MAETLIIKSRFQGPPDSGNGGYSAGLLGKLIDGPAVVRLRIPPPLDSVMQVRRDDTGIALFHGDNLVASAKPASVEIDIPEPPGIVEAEAASRLYRGFMDHFYPACFVCGPERDHGDGLRVFAGPVDENGDAGDVVAAVWTPDESLSDKSGRVYEEYIWAALDCPGAYSFPEPLTGTILLGELTVSIEAAVSVGEKCILIGWEIKHEGRKHYTGTALFNESGKLYAHAYATWFEVPDKTQESSVA